MIVYLVTATLPDDRSLIVGIYATKELANEVSDRLRGNVGSVYSAVFVTECDVIGG